MTLDEDIVGLAPESWTPDGEKLLFTVVTADAGFVANISTLSMDGDGAAELLIEDEFLTSSPAISPDGGWIAYDSTPKLF